MVELVLNDGGSGKGNLKFKNYNNITLFKNNNILMACIASSLWGISQDIASDFQQIMCKAYF